MAKYKITDPSSGKTYEINAPSGTSSEELKAKVQQMSSSVMQNKQQIGDDVYQRPEIVNRRGHGRSANAKSVKEKTDRSRLDYLASAFGRSPAAYQRAKDLESMPGYQKGTIALGEEFHKLGTGTADLVDMGLEGLGSDDATVRREERADREASADDVMREFRQKEGLYGATRMAPYLLSGYLAGPAIEAGIARGASKLGSIAKLGSNKVLGKVAPRMNRGIQNMGKSNAKKVRSDRLPGETGLATRVAGNAALGYLEGGLHFDDSAVGSALASVLGGASGRRAANYVEPVINQNNRTVNKALDAFQDAGGHVTPGIRTGQLKRQTKESGQAQDDRWSGLYDEHRKGNQVVTNEIAAEAMGMPPGTRLDDFSPQELGSHRKALKAEYEKLEANTSSAVSISEMNAMKRRIKKMSKTPMNKDSAKTLKPLLKKMQGSSIPREGTGTVMHRDMSGKNYKELRSEIVDERNKAAIDGNNGLSTELNKMVKMLDEGMERGLKTLGSGNSAKQWSDLRENYAITKMVMDNGMNPSGAVDLKKLGKHLEATDMDRMLLEEGGKVQNLHSLARVNWIEGKKRGGGLTGSGVHDPKDKTGEVSNFISTPNDVTEPWWRRKLYDIYQSGYPANTGILGLPRKARIPENLSRAASQGVDTIENLGHMALGGVADSADYVNDTISDFLTRGGYEPKGNELTLEMKKREEEYRREEARLREESMKRNGMSIQMRPLRRASEQ
jgi:hypothetical protein